jgi:hypothetical protein
MDLRNLLLEFSRFRKRSNELGAEVRVDPTRRNGVAPDSLRAMVDGNGTRQRVERRLGRPVGGMPGT